MADLAIDAVAEFGLNKDVLDYRLRPEEWTDLLNMRFESKKLRRLLGHQSTFGTPPVAPVHWFPAVSGAAHLWIWMGIAKAYVWDGTVHTDLTPVADFTTGQASDWQATIMNGIPIINNGKEKPHYWDFNTANNFAVLPNWDADTIAKVVRALGPFLFYGNTTVLGARRPHRIGWSHPAEPGTLPSSYDYDDPEKDAGQFDLSDQESGEILEMLPLKGRMYVYKEAASHVLSYIGGQNIWERKDFLTTSGILAQRCAGITGDGQQHFVVTQDDIILHDGARAAGLLDARLKRWLFQNIDPVSYSTSFVFTNPRFKEMWFCYPEQGADRPTRALGWNYELGSPGKFFEADVQYTWGSSGTIETAGGETWDESSGTWDSDEGQWASVQRRRTIVGYQPATKFYLMDEGLTRDGNTFPATARRTALTITGQTKEREPIVDFKQKVMLTRAWIRGEGGPFNVRFGVQQRVPATPQFGPVFTSFFEFDPNVDMYVDSEPPVEGRAVSIEFSTTAAVDWGLSGYTLEMFPTGLFG